jgi:hypothetical protein
MSEEFWKIEVIEQWNLIDLKGFCRSLKIDFGANFLIPLAESKHLSNPFEGMQFDWFPHSQVPEGLIHLYPLTPPRNEIIWEEWFIKSDGCHHHVLRNYEHLDATDAWFGDDLDHPSQVCNIKWFYKNDPDLRPIALR